jgi:hypothetical protein
MAGEQEFLLKEYESLKAETLSRTEEARTLERLSAGAVAGVLSWFAASHLAFGLIWWTPVAIAILGFVRAYARANKMELTNTYLRKLECHFLPKEKPFDELGWCHFQKKSKDRQLSNATISFWVTLLIITLGAPFLLRQNPRPAGAQTFELQCSFEPSQGTMQCMKK